MNETIKDLIVAIAEGDSVAIDSTFSSIMANKIADRLDDIRVSVAQNMFGDTPIMEEVEYYDESLDEEALDEISKPLMASYVKSAQKDREERLTGASFRSGKKGDEFNTADETRSDVNRAKGINRALDKMSKTSCNEEDESYSAKDAAAGKDIGKPGKNFEKIAQEAGKKYGSQKAGERVAGAILAKLRK